MLFKSKYFLILIQISIDILHPFLYFILQAFVSVSILRNCSLIVDDVLLDILSKAFIPFSILTFIFYLFAAFTNPGYIIGDEQI